MTDSFINPEHHPQETPEEIHLCSSCEWCVVGISSAGGYVSFCLCMESENYLEPVSVLDYCEAWEEEKMFV